MKVLYTASATVTGEGRNGHGRTSDGLLDVDLAACFHSAIKFVGRWLLVYVDGSTVEADVGICPNDGGGFGLQVALTASLPNVDQDVADRIVAAAHQVCPYSNATRGNIDVTVRAIGR